MFRCAYPKLLLCRCQGGANGEGQAAAGFPRLAGQNKVYLVKQLQAFNGRRTDPVMQAFAQMLNAQQISDVAEYYVSLPP